MPKNQPQEPVEATETGPEALETQETVEAVSEAPDPAEGDDEPGDLDPEAYIMGADGEPKPMPTGEWTAATTPSGNLRRSKGLLVEA